MYTYYYILLILSILNEWMNDAFIFSQYLDFLAPSDSIFSNSIITGKYCPIITNQTSMESVFIEISDDV